MIDRTINLISGFYHEYERTKHHFSSFNEFFRWRQAAILEQHSNQIFRTFKFGPQRTIENVSIHTII